MIIEKIKSLISKFTIYKYMISFLVVLHLVSVFFYGFSFKSLIPVLIAIITTVTLDLSIEYFKSKKNQLEKNQIQNSIFFPHSGLISGLFIGGLLTQNLQWYIYVLAGIIAILSKRLIKVQQKHIFNPANLGILLVSIIFGASHTWWISSPIILVLIFGIFIIWRLRRYDLTISFLATYFLINIIIQLFRREQFLDFKYYYIIINGGVIYFFSMFMLIEPKTNPTARKQRIVYGILIALLFIIFQFYPQKFNNAVASFLVKHNLPLALAVGNIFVPILNRFKFEFKKKEEEIKKS